ncbi:dnaJ homolog subfamily C member 24-like [Glandiceps talaboti]
MATKSEPEIDFYTILNAKRSSSYNELKQCYQKMILKYHPDKIDQNLSTEEQSKAMDKFIAIDKAWKILGNEQSRREYDANLQEREVSQKWPVNSEVDLDEMDYNEANGEYSFGCRCSGEYIITEEDMLQGVNIICCSSCTLSIRVLYQLECEDL